MQIQRQICRELASATFCGAAIGAPAAALGWQLGERYGQDVVQIGIRQAVPLMQSGWVSPHTLLKWGPTALRPLVQAQAGAFLLGAAGIVAGTMLGVALARA